MYNNNISNDSTVSNDSKVLGRSEVSGRSRVLGGSEVSDRSRILGRSEVSGGSKIYDTYLFGSNVEGLEIKRGKILGKVNRRKEVEDILRRPIVGTRTARLLARDDSCIQRKKVDGQNITIITSR